MVVGMIGDHVGAVMSLGGSSPSSTAIFNEGNAMKTIAHQINVSNDITFICDKSRHLICKPYSEANMLFMATEFGINPLWHHKDHYDILINKIK